MDKYMKEWRFKEIKKFIPMIHADTGRKENDPWWQIVSAIEEFNLNRSVRVASSIWKIFDESMSAFRPQTTPTGNLPHLSFVERKPEPLGTEFKTCCCSETGIMLSLEVVRGKSDQTLLPHDDIKAHTAAVSVRLAELSKRERHDVDKDLTEDIRKVEDKKTDIYQGDSWFASIPTLKLIQSRVGCRFKGLVKTAHAGFPKDYLEDTMKNFPGGFHMVLKAPVDNDEPEGEQMYAIGYKYSSRKVLCFIASENTGTTLPGKGYEARWTDRHQNTHCRKIDRPRVVSTYFERSNCIDIHNQVRQAELALEKCWVTKCGYFRIITTLFGITVTDCWKAYRFHLSNKSRHKSIPMKHFVSMLTKDMLTNTFPNTRTEDVDLFLGSKKIEDEVSKHTGTVISYGNSTIIDTSTISGRSPAFLLSNHTMCIYPKSADSRTTRRRCWWCYHKKDKKECYTRWYCKECGYVPICPDGSGRGCDRFCWREHLEAGGIVKVEDSDGNAKK